MRHQSEVFLHPVSCQEKMQLDANWLIDFTVFAKADSGLHGLVLQVTCLAAIEECPQWKLSKLDRNHHDKEALTKCKYTSVNRIFQGT